MKKKTFQDTFVFNYFISKIASLILQLRGWKLKGEVPKESKCIIIFSPHTSNWDGVLGGLMIAKLRIKLFVMAKDKIFIFPFKNFLLWLGVIPINRDKKSDTVRQIVEEFKTRDAFKIFVVPSGTRKKVEKWKSGFYYIAKGANVPIILSFIDYKKKEYGFIKKVYVTDDLEESLREIQLIYKQSNITGKHSDNNLFS